MKFRTLPVFAAVALALAACQGGLDSGGGGMPGDVGPPVGNPGQIGASPGGMNGNDMQGPEIGPNGQPALTVPGSTLAPNEAQYPVGQGPSGMKCPQISVQMQQFNCTLSFNIPPPTPTPSPGPGGVKATPAPTPTPSPSPSPSSSSDDDDDSGGASPSPTPPGTITMQVEALPKDVPPMTNPDRRALSVTPLVAIRLQSDSNFNLNGLASVQYVLPRQQLPSRGFWIQLYNEGVLRGKRVDQFLGSYTKYISNDQIIQFNFPTPKLTVKRGQIWMLAMYGLTYPPNATATPSPTPAASGSPSTSSFTPGPSPSASATP
ncbi:MAG TPA: hypothetical protein VFE36_04065 [Candidatus Baltobacteraceae bacterium]|nr:hypothetical protein [Candidatus Baltobacteraceae bacterium]